MSQETCLKITLVAARVNRKLTQRYAATELGISRNTLQNYESGKTIPNWGMVKKMETLYGISFDYIFLPL